MQALKIAPSLIEWALVGVAVSVFADGETARVHPSHWRIRGRYAGRLSRSDGNLRPAPDCRKSNSPRLLQGASPCSRDHEPRDRGIAGAIAHRCRPATRGTRDRRYERSRMPRHCRRHNRDRANRRRRRAVRMLLGAFHLADHLLPDQSVRITLDDHLLADSFGGQFRRSWESTAMRATLRP